MIKDKVLVSIFVPAIGSTYDVFVPLTTPLAEVTKLISYGIMTVSSESFCEQNLILCDRRSGQIFDSNMRVFELGITSGSELILL